MTDDSTPEKDLPVSTLVTRSAFGGVLMGLANLVPGISGGTMLLAAGIYPKFIDAIAELTRLKFKTKSIVLLGSVVAAAGVSILLLAGVLKDLVVDYRWIMYSLFIGLTLGGIPIVWKLAKPASPSFWIGASVSFALMVLLAFLQATGYVGSAGTSFVMLFVAGVAGASAMILPGLSGGYLLLLLGQYVPILSAIDSFKEALKARDVAAAMDPALSVMLPVGVGVVLGVVAVGNLLQWLLNRYRKLTLGVLMGLLVGSTAGLFPFQLPVEPEIGQTIKGAVVTAESISEIEKEDWLTEFFAPNVVQIGGAIGLVAMGFILTMAVARIGEHSSDSESDKKTAGG